MSIIPAASTSLRGASTDSCLYPLRCRLSPLESSDRVHLSSAMCMFSLMSGLATEMFGRLPVFSLNWSTMASFTLYATNFECLNSSEKTTESTAKQSFRSRYLLQSIFFTSLYTSSALSALKCLIGFRMRIAVCSWKLARYIISLLPVNDTIRRPISTLFAPSCVSSCASTGSSPIKVLAMSSNSCSIIEFKI